MQVQSLGRLRNPIGDGKGDITDYFHKYHWEGKRYPNYLSANRRTPKLLLRLGTGQRAELRRRVGRDAAGFGWFVDPTPDDDVEFAVQLDAYSLAADQDSPAALRADLLTTVMHEFGHVLGYDHADEGLMDDLLPLGARRTAATDKVFGGYGQ